MRNLRKISILVMLISFFSSVVYSHPTLEDIDFTFQQLFELGSAKGYNFALDYNYSRFSAEYNDFSILAMFDSDKRIVAVQINIRNYNIFKDMANIAINRFGSGQYINRIRSEGYEAYFWQLSQKQLIGLYEYPNDDLTSITLNNNFFNTIWLW